MSAGQQRLFIGVPLPTTLQSFVAEAQRALPPTQGLRLLSEEQWHVTIAFLGEVEQTGAAVAQQIVEQVPASWGGESHLGNFLFLPSPNKARVVALAVQDEQRVFARLYEGIMNNLETAGLVRREKRPFRPHLTVARLKTPGPVQPKTDITPVQMAVESVCLYKSELRRGGAIYTVLAQTRLHS